MALTQYDSAEHIKGDARAALIDLLYRLGDDDLVIGHRHTEWTGLAPILEADIAFSSIAQDQIGQAQAYYTLLHELGEPDPDSLVFDRDCRAFRCASLCVFEKRTWAFSTVRHYLYDACKELKLAALIESTYTPLAKLTRKLRGEQKYHVMHGRMWISRLGNATEESHGLMQSAVDALFPHALGLFEQTEHSEKTAAFGLGPDEATLCDAWRETVTGTLTESGLQPPLDAEPIYGGRRGEHIGAMTELLDAMRKVHKLDPTAKW